jgi:L-amino acid N-acyltransferase YncA
MIRDAVEADLPTIVTIYNAAIPCQVVTADFAPVTIESRLAWFQAHTLNHHPLWVIDFNGTVAGWLGFQPFYGRPAYQSTAELSLYVHPDYQRMGIGRKLLGRAIETAPALKLATLLGFIFADNHPSLKLFQQFDFEQWGYLPRVAKFDRGDQDLVILGRRI